MSSNVPSNMSSIDSTLKEETTVGDLGEGKSAVSAMQFDINSIRNYPKSNKKLSIEISPYNLMESEKDVMAVQSLHISPFGIEFQSGKSFLEGSLVKVQVSMPGYWERKQKLVEYHRIDQPEKFNFLGKVVHTEEVGKRGRKRLVTVQTVNIDDIDAQVLRSFLHE